jgi:hypothetical protein
MLTTGSIDPSVKDFFKPMSIDPSVHIQPMVSIHRSKIGSHPPIFLNEGKPVNILQ